MDKSKTLLIYFISSILTLAILLLFQLKFPALLELETRWIVLAITPIIIGIILTKKVKKIGAFGFDVEVFPSQRKMTGDEEDKIELIVNLKEKKIPADYFFINHTSFLRPEIQEEFQKATKVNRPHYDIRVIINSYYRGALEQVKYVQYYLHKNYPEPIRIRSNLSNKFCLKEIANGEFVLTAKVYLKEIEKPIILERYITLWESGPRINE
ncbi:pYEATS domain-containing protein [Algoriphagus sediminis]|uniref:YEATS domain-containing protein n=1 Tax=Algoriphagus sediminis TaxID=3057113 RepID=A0ABT7YFK9_9BACT|nr:pYEATS domain-containing protein [Algoriphagus sediminis]MDN3205273.1 hypothetical protein [Algoriphagus sediminis]